MTFVPDNILRHMDPAERKKRGRAGMTQAEATRTETLRIERQDHADFANYLLLKGIWFEHENPTRRSTSRRGWPDFRCFYFGHRFLEVEFKIRPNKLSREQEEVRAMLESFGFAYVVAYSLSEAIEATHTHLLS